ncbi:MAG: CvpA family protein [Bacteroidota bacterium]
MNWVDLILLIVMLLSIIAGWSRGFILSSLSLMVWTGSLILAYLFYPYTARGLDNFFSLHVWLSPLSFILTAIIARLLLGTLAGFIIRRTPENINHNAFNKFLGIIPGAINGWLYAIILSALLLMLPLKDGITNETRNSRFAGQLALQSEWANKKLAPVFDKAIQQTLISLTVNPASKESVALRFTYDKAVPRPNLEAQMLNMINKERRKAGLPAFSPDPEMTNVARAHSQDMFRRGYFAHVNPEGKDPFDRMKEANVHFYAAGENLALAQTLQIAHTNLMNSPGHRANILNSSFHRVGIGILDGGFYGLMISQEFRN